MTGHIPGPVPSIPRVGSVVHVRDEAAGACVPAMVTRRDTRVAGLLRLRVFRPAGSFSPAGSDDDESYYPHHTDAQTVATGRGRPARRLDSWHEPVQWDGCPEA